MMKNKLFLISSPTLSLDSGVCPPSSFRVHTEPYASLFQKCGKGAWPGCLRHMAELPRKVPSLRPVLCLPKGVSTVSIWFSPGREPPFMGPVPLLREPAPWVPTQPGLRTCYSPRVFSRMPSPLLCSSGGNRGDSKMSLLFPLVTQHANNGSRVSTPDSPVPPWVNVPMLEDHRLSCLRVHFHETQV